MGIVLIAGLLVVVVLAIYLKTTKHPDLGTALTLSAVSVGCLFMLSLFLSLMLPAEAEEDPTVIPIFALQDGSQANGQFFLGTGKVEETSYYFYMTQGEHGKQMEKKEIGNDVYLNDEESGSPRLEIVSLVSASSFGKWFFGTVPVGTRYVFYVPKGAVTSEFRVDMQ